MKRIMLTMLLAFLGMSAFAQSPDPVEWNFEVKLKSAGTYEVIATANVEKPWHLYSQNTGKGGPIPTKFTFKKNPLITVSGAVKETGKLEKVYDKNFKTDVLFYGGTVKFTQLITVKGKAKTNISGVVEYMVCDDSQCLPPTKKAFDLKLP
ncbi:protein-disulfide reductase DsbD domain-containing protein [Sediminibacterium ginsengisoli]|uniref:Disulphide bond corrector protein DsbC n=1 Tax=Sediminibacterium ginsengisoli TaxID=413434 RepID=A0A1T4K776_9BACT|nr:protein-disulfide reductase DsbD domain-containing protein [Sediminibacterium ginsengisoli]SJZ38165.1 Disulphide bond corrector protein DsbC [Sediminibacterium ginsengisoli]